MNDARGRSDHSASPGTCHLELPSAFRARKLASKAFRATQRAGVARRKVDVRVEVDLRRPLREENGYTSVKKAGEQDEAHVLQGLQPFFARKGLEVGGLELTFLRRVNPTFYEPYDLVKATFTVMRGTP